MIKSLSFARALVLSGTFCSTVFCQDAPAAKVPLDHYLGTITAVDAAAHTVTLQEDKTGTVHVIGVGETKTILKVEPTAKDLKNAVRITADNLQTGDRIDVRGSKSDTDPATLNARSVILMSARALEEHHQQQAAAWTHSTNGIVTAVDAAASTVTMNARAAGAMQSISIKTTSVTEFTRYSPEGGKSVPSQLAQIEVGDQLRVVGDKNDDGSVISAQRVYSGAFRTISATISALGADGKSLTVKDLASKKEMSVSLAPDSAIHKLPPMMAGMLARRLNPSAAPAGGPGAPAGGPGGPGQGGPWGPGQGGPGQGPGGPGQGEPGQGGPSAGRPSSGNPNDPAAGGPPSGMPGAGGPPSGMPGAGGPPSGGRGDISQMIEHLPKIGLGELKAGDALVISGVATGPANSQLLATTVIAGVEPILQAAPQQRGGRSVGGDWGLGEMSAPQ